MNKENNGFTEKIISIDRVSRTVKGGKRMRFRVLVVIGDKKGSVGMGLGKANEVALAVNKATNQARKHLIKVNIVNETISHEITTRYGSAKVFLKPAKKGTSVIAGGSVRAVLELVGIKNILSKIYGSSNKINNVKATLLALSSLRQAKVVDDKAKKATK